MVKLCVNCKWFSETRGKYALCGRPLGIEVVYGSMRYNDHYCGHERENSRHRDTCGTKGYYFEPAPKLAPPPPSASEDAKFKNGPIVDHEPPNTKNMLATILTNWGMGRH